MSTKRVVALVAAALIAGAVLGTIGTASGKDQVTPSSTAPCASAPGACGQAGAGACGQSGACGQAASGCPSAGAAEQGACGACQ